MRLDCRSSDRGVCVASVYVVAEQRDIEGERSRDKARCVPCRERGYLSCVEQTIPDPTLSDDSVVDPGTSTATVADRIPRMVAVQVSIVSGALVGARWTRRCAPVAVVRSRLPSPVKVTLKERLVFCTTWPVLTSPAYHRLCYARTSAMADKPSYSIPGEYAFATTVPAAGASCATCIWVDRDGKRATRIQAAQRIYRSLRTDGAARSGQIEIPTWQKLP